MYRLIPIIIAVASLASPGTHAADVAAFAVGVAHVSLYQVDAADLIALGWMETAGTYRSDRVSRAGACGVLQVMPRWSSFTCTDMQDTTAGVAAGAVSWLYWQRRMGAYAAAGYNGGNKPGERARRYHRAWRAVRRAISLDITEAHP